MNAQTANENMFIKSEKISAEDFLNMISKVYGTFLAAYDSRDKKLLYTIEQLGQLGYDTIEAQQPYLSLEDIIHPDDLNQLENVLKALTEQNGFPSTDIRLQHQDGSYVRYKLRARQKLNVYMTILLFVNEQSAFDEIDEINELKRTKAEVISELQRSNKELEEFAYVASHDLQEPLRKISTFCGRLADKFTQELSDEGKLYIDRIMASAENMRILIDNLLEFSRISRIQQPFVDLNLNFVLQQVKNELELTIEETGAKIIADKLPVVQASLSQMKQLFNNVLNNAIKFRKPDVAPEINILSHQLSSSEKKLYKLQPDKEFCSIRFCDNGIGFENEYANKIFQIFQRLHGKSDYPGSGIGLAICKKIADQHHGIIFAENILHKGACFTLILPMRQP